ncbi:MAG: hypothetical protein AAF206_08145 [Bacteroidota bacterium]
MKNILLSDKLPYMLTVLIGLAAYQINNIIALHADSPLLVYAFDVKSIATVENGIERDWECTLTNLSRKEAIRDINLTAAFKSTLPSPRKIMVPDIIPIAPSPILRDQGHVESFADQINSYKIPVVHPRAQYILRMTTITHPDIKEPPKLYINSSENIRLTPGSLEVFLIRHQITLNIILLVIWSGFIMLYLIYIRDNQPS